MEGLLLPAKAGFGVGHRVVFPRLQSAMQLLFAAAFLGKELAGEKSGELRGGAGDAQPRLRKPGVDLLMETRVADIIRDEKILDKYRRAGIVHIYMGVEATDQRTLDRFNKNLKVEDSKKAIDLVNAQDIVSETSFVLGMPHDTHESIAATLELAKYYNPDMAFFLAIAPWPYAEIYAELKIHVEEKDFRRYNLVEAVVKPLGMSRSELERDLLETTKKFYMDKMLRFSALSSGKQEFMRSVMELLMRHSYLSEHIKASAEGMPESVKRLLNLNPIP
jgi:anaerobic magnesium-protoporphyrin IX monomethyl ester cyclase